MAFSRLPKLMVALAGATYAMTALPVIAGTEDVFSNSFETPFNTPANDAEAARFLNQATFGATAADITQVKNLSISGWLDAQLNSATTTLSRPWLEAYTVTLGANTSISQNDRLHRWFNVAVTAPDQLRQRVAYSLSQILVTSDQNDVLANYPIMMAEYNDIMVRNAFGNYRTLMEEVTLSPMMGRYLTTMRNRKFELVPQGNPIQYYTAGNSGVQPDENYAREIMQLFSIGLVRRNDDFSLFDGDSGTAGIQTVPTYDEDTISTLARVFTGLSHDCSGNQLVAGVTINRNCAPTTGPTCTGQLCRFANASALFGNDPPLETRLSGSNSDRGLLHPDWYRSMVCYPRYHDNGRDTSGNVLADPNNPPPLNPPPNTPGMPAGSPEPDKIITINGTTPLQISPSVINGASPLNCHRTGNPSPLSQAEMDACVAYCNNNIDAAIDMLFNHPNTPVMVSRQLIERLVTSNPSPEYIQRVTAVFKDNGVGVRGDLKAVIRAILLDTEARQPPSTPGQPVNFGKVREPLLKLVALWRSMGAVSADTGTFPVGNPLSGQPARRRWGPIDNTPQDAYSQRPFGAPTVFNFFLPDYQQPGPVSSTGLDGSPSAAGLFSPELQIIHEVSTITASNDLFGRICAGYGGTNNNCSGAFTAPTDRAYFPVATVDSWPAVTTPDQLIEFYNTRLLGGTMSGTMLTGNTCPQGVGTGTKGTLYYLMRCQNLATTITGGTQTDRDRRAKLYILHLVAVSPEFATQK